MNQLEIERKLRALTRADQLRPTLLTRRWRMGFRDGLCWAIDTSPLEFPFPWEKGIWRDNKGKE